MRRMQWTVVRGEEPSSARTEALLLDEPLPGVVLLDVVGQSWNVLPDLRIFGNSLHLSPERSSDEVEAW